MTTLDTQEYLDVALALLAEGHGQAEEIGRAHV